MKYFLKSERLGFREWTEADLPLAIELWCDPQVNGFIGGPWTAEMVRARLLQEIERGRTFGVQYWPVFLLEDSGHAGCAGLRPWRGEKGILELGIHLRPAFWRQGLALEAARVLIDFGLESLGLDALITGHHPENAASRGLLRKLGFVYTHDELYPPTGLMHPIYLLRKSKVQTLSAP